MNLHVSTSRSNTLSRHLPLMALSRPFPMCHYNRLLHAQMGHIGSKIVDLFKSVVVSLLSLIDLNTGVPSHTYHQKRLSLTALHFRARSPPRFSLLGIRLQGRYRPYLSCLGFPSASSLAFVVSFSSSNVCCGLAPSQGPSIVISKLLQPDLLCVNISLLQFYDEVSKALAETLKLCKTNPNQAQMKVSP